MAPLNLTRAALVVAILSGLIGAGACRAYQWVDKRVDVSVRWEEVSTP